MEAIVLAGGLGQRLKGVISDVPKPMAPINGKPFLDFVLMYLQANNVKRVVLSVGYSWEVIKSYFGARFEDIDIIYSVERELLGTGGAIKKALEYIQGKNVLILNGDTFFNVNLKELVLIPGSRLTIALKHMENFSRYGCVEIDQSGLVTEFQEKTFRESGNINGGIYLASHDLFADYELCEKFSFEMFLQENFSELKVAAKVFNDYFIDIGIPEDYCKAQNELMQYI